MIKNLKINKKKIMALLVASMISICGSAHAISSEKKYEKLPIICQRDKTFFNHEIKYNGYNFHDCGCAPSSVINMLLSLFDYETNDILPFVKESLKAFATEHQPSINNVSTDNVINILSSDYIEQNRDDYPIIDKLLKSKNSKIYKLNKNYTWNDLQPIIIKNSNSFITIGKTSITENWNEIIKIICNLYDLEQYDVNLLFSLISVGNDACTDAPFYSGSSGHYVSMSINVKEFYEEGTFCILDSYQRAIFDEVYGDDEQYKKAYPFVAKKGYFKDFNNYFIAERINDNVIKISLREPYRKNLNDIKKSTNINQNEKIVEYLKQIYKKVIFYGSSVFVIDIPNNIKEKDNIDELYVEEKIIHENNKRLYFR